MPRAVSPGATSISLHALIPLATIMRRTIRVVLPQFARNRPASQIHIPKTSGQPIDGCVLSCVIGVISERIESLYPESGSI